MRVIGSSCPVGVFPKLYGILGLKLGKFLLKRRVFRSGSPDLRVEKDKEHIAPKVPF